MDTIQRATKLQASAPILDGFHLGGITSTASLCNTHIDAEDFGYCDPGERWMREKCYERYVVPRDLSCFVEDDEIAS